MNQDLSRLLWNSCKKDVIRGLICTPFHAVLEIFFALSIGVLVQLIYIDYPRIDVIKVVPKDLRAFFQFNQTLDRKDLVLIVPLIMIGIAFLRMISSFLSSYFIEIAGLKVAQTLRVQILTKFLDAKGNTLDLLNPDVTANQIYLDSLAFQSFISRGVVSLIRDGLVLVIGIAMSFFISFKIMFTILIMMIPLVFLLKITSQKIRFYASKSNELTLGLASRIQQSRMGFVYILFKKMQEIEFHKFVTLINNFFVFSKSTIALRVAFRPVTEVVAIVFLAGILQWRIASAQVQIDAPTLSSIAILFAFMFRPLKNVSQFVGIFSEFSVLKQRLFSLWKKLSTQVSSQSLVLPPIHSHEAIRIENLQLTSNQGSSILNINFFECKVGEKIALVGKSGSGKTSFIRCLAQTLIADTGNIFINKDMCLCPQVPYLFRGTVGENLSYSYRHPLHFDQLSDSVLKLGLSKSIGGAPFFLHKSLGFLGDGLSGGEKARVALGRVLSYEPSILLFDEPTANLDRLSSKSFWEALKEWQTTHPKSTIVAVTHSPEELIAFQRVVKLENGCIVWQGSKEEYLRILK